MGSKLWIESQKGLYEYYQTDYDLFHTNPEKHRCSVSQAIRMTNSNFKV